MAEAQGLALNESASALARAFWPGPLTLVLPGGSGRLPDVLRGPEGGIAVRWTSHRGMARLVRALGEPVTSTSANLPGSPPAPGAEAIVRDFAPAVEAGTLLVLDGGVLILTMARHHRARVDELGGEGHVFVLGEYAGREGDDAEVSDPFGGDLDVYRDTCAELEALLQTAVERIVKEFASGSQR